MSSAVPGRLRDFFSSRTGIAVAAIAALCLAGATAFALRGDGEPKEEAIPLTTTTSTTAPPVQPETGAVLLGASTSTEIRSLAAEKSAVEGLEAKIGRTLDIDHNFYNWDEAFPTETEQWDLAAGRIPMISWNGRGVTTKRIASRAFDDMDRQRARGTTG